MKCNKCNQDKPDTEFQTYFHSTQNVYRTRRQCNQCFYDAKKQLRLSKKMRMCIVCEEQKLFTDFPNYKSLGSGDKRRNICKICTCEIEKDRRNRRLNNNEEKGETVPFKPNTYNSEQQRIDGFQLMEALGFTFVEETGRWHKEGFKNPDGTFVRIIEKKRLDRERKLKEIEELNVWDKIRYLREQGYSLNKISEEIGVNYTAVFKFLYYGKEVKLRN